MMIPLLLKTSLLLCMLRLAGSQWVGSANNVYSIANFLHKHCEDFASFLPLMCGTAGVGPACCGFFSIVDFCSPSCAGSSVLATGQLKLLMYDAGVCAALRLTSHTLCQGSQSWTHRCQQLNCLMNMMCFPFYNFACYHSSMRTSNNAGTGGTIVTVGEGNPQIQANTGGTTGKVQDNCFELPELADGELTGLIDDRQSERRQCPHDEVEPECQTEAKLRYRTVDGSCNNLQNPTWGKSFEPQRRLLPSQLVDGNLPRSRAQSGNSLPLARSISRAVSPMRDLFADVTNMVMAWGQFIDHDFTGTPVIKNGTQKIKCCGDIDEDLKAENGGPCFPIPIPSGDPLGRDCMQFVRSLPYSFPNGTQLEPREQINTLTSFLDASAVYGNTQDVLDKLRGENGLLKMSKHKMLPESTSLTCKKEKQGDYCFMAGDHRVNVFVGLGALHTTFVREHNRIAHILQDLNPDWDPETVFQQTRRIVSAEFQHVTYAEWLPLVLDDDTMTQFRLKEGDFQYDPEVDPTIFNVFSTAVFRFGHSQVKQKVKIGTELLDLQDTLMRPYYTLHNMTDVIRGIVSAPTDDVDHFFATGLTNHMFETNSTMKDGLDLVSINIQRGRDHGLPPFNDWRKACKLPRITDFASSELTLDMTGIYESMDDVDLFVGLMVERPVAGGLVGPTLACLLGRQFNHMKFGDRFFYETRVAQERFTEDQLREIRKVSLARILCDNLPDLKEIQANVFRLEDFSTNSVESCDRLPSMDLKNWKFSVPDGQGGSPVAQASTTVLTGKVQSNCFELPELADGELTGLINDKESELRQCPHENVSTECTAENKLRYRTIDGSCNNLQNPTWGKSFKPQRRLLPSQLEDGNLPRSRAQSGNSLPLARSISRAVSPMRDLFADVTNMVMAWGQFIDHDFTGTPVIKNGTQAIKCCGQIDEELKVENGGPCFPIPIPSGDPLGRDCMQFVRSVPYSFPNGTQLEPREQINTLTSFLDASAVYGNTQDVLDKLRGDHGLMKMSEKNMLPENPSATCKILTEGDYCLMAGDHRVNVFVGLGALHTTFVREHNRIAHILQDLNPDWDPETVFQETRRIISAEFQHVTYAEWLPLVLDDDTMTQFRLKEGDFLYDPEVDPTIFNVFSTAVFRFGHSQVKQKVKIGTELLDLQDTLMRPFYTLHNMTDAIRGIVSAPTDDVDRFFATGLTNHMFETNSTLKDGLDLVSINIQRGRDHGLPPFNDWRKACKLPRITDFASSELTLDMTGIYESMDDVDLFVGLMVERPVAGGLVGPTLACLLGRQFNHMKFGDRFFYETRAAQERFTEDQLREIRKVSLARILCDNLPDLKEIQPNVFRLEDFSTNSVESCDRLPSMDLNNWKFSVPDGQGGSPVAQASTTVLTGKVQSNCFELPELADGELTGLINDKESELRQCPHENVSTECTAENKLRYRTIDGSCNNLQNPTWGKSFEPQRRLLPSQLEDGNLPRSRAQSGNSLPLARSISRAVSPMRDLFADVTNMVMAWGQFIDHDFTGTPVIKNGTQAIKCCGQIDEELKVENGGPCFPIPIPCGDPLGRDCMQFVRSLPYSFPNGTQLEPREQINTLTSFLDASAVYGNTQDVLDKLRGDHGLMKMSEKNMLPENPSATCKILTEGDYCLMAGDHRVNVFVGLGALHTTFVREHNRIAHILQDLNPDWDPETVFQETRRIISAEFQHVTYAEWLPLVLDDDTMTQFRLKEGDFLYDPEVDPTIFNVFSTAVFRFGHSQVKQKVKIGTELLDLQDTLMRPFYTLHNMTDAIRGIVSAPTDDVDRFFATGLTNHMFETNSTLKDGLDLVSINIQRGRDHGLPPFNDWRKACKLPRITDFASSELTLDMTGIYESMDDVDLFVGLMVERPVAGGLVGPTLACLLGRQFNHMKFGDRFFYETRAAQERFTEDQLREIRKVSLARILCDNLPDLKEIQANVFRLEDFSANSMESCDRLPSMDLKNWKFSVPDGQRGSPVAQASITVLTCKVQSNCFELPELADGELTGLINDKESELRQCPHENVSTECTAENKLRYRTIDGSCNNLQNPTWGKSFEPQRRLLPSQLEDGNLPRSRAQSGNSLPLARSISRVVSPMRDLFADVTNMVMAWGQFIDHDFTGTPVIKNGTQAIKCCGQIDEELKVENGGPCFPIPIPCGDPLGRDCMQFVRSLPYSFPNGTQLEPREQINTLTSFLDASAVYGNTQDVLDKLRGDHGLMKMSEKNMLPENPSATCKILTEGDYCLMAGDHRVNVFVGLGALHTTFVREHNRIAHILQDLNPDWDPETVFQETRRIISAEFQHVTYAEWLPLVLDDDTMTQFRLKEGDFLYDPKVDPTIFNVFSTAVFRFGHSQVKQKVKIGTELLDLQDTLMRPFYTLHNMTDAIRGIVSAPTDDVDRFFATGLTNHMFETNSTLKDGLDLVSINIQRGRDHGLPPFNDWRKACKLPRITDFASSELTLDMTGIYESMDDVDLFVGLMVERQVAGGLVGPTLACLLGRQFNHMKFGDRFFYETQAAQERFTENQLREIRKVSLARILCDNLPDLKEIQANVFRLEDLSTNPMESCDKLPSMDLNNWKSP